MYIRKKRQALLKLEKIIIIACRSRTTVARFKGKIRYKVDFIEAKLATGKIVMVVLE